MSEDPEVLQSVWYSLVLFQLHGNLIDIVHEKKNNSLLYYPCPLTMGTSIFCSIIYNPRNHIKIKENWKAMNNYWKGSFDIVKNLPCGYFTKLENLGYLSHLITSALVLGIFKKMFSISYLEPLSVLPMVPELKAVRKALKKLPASIEESLVMIDYMNGCISLSESKHSLCFFLLTWAVFLISNKIS